MNYEQYYEWLLTSKESFLQHALQAFMRKSSNNKKTRENQLINVAFDDIWKYCGIYALMFVQFKSGFEPFNVLL